jgi:hypothetical protein
MKAKTILKDKFWILEEEGNNIGTLSWGDDRYMFSSKNKTLFFENKKEIKNTFGLDISITEDTEHTIDPNKEIYNFSTSVIPYNSMYDIKRKLPLFTKSNKSKSLYCAGYYIIRFEKGWVKSFCPKLITVERYEYRGPFKTELEMRQELSRV